MRRSRPRSSSSRTCATRAPTASPAWPVVPTFGRDAILGTNPIAIAIPCEGEPFLFDAATSVVPRGKLEVYDRLGKSMPLGWAVDARGKGTANAREVLDNLIKRRGGGILPLGGEGEEFSGQKGSGTALA